MSDDGTIIDLLKRIADGLDAAATEALSADQAARMLGMSRSKFYDLDARGLVPARLHVGDLKDGRWMRRELVDWLAAGCPPRATWVWNRPRRAG